MLKIYASIGLIAALLGGSGVWYIQHLRGENERLGSANADLTAAVDRMAEQASAERGAAISNAVLTTAVQAASKESHAKLNKAAAVAPDWANVAVPDAVLDAIGVPQSPGEAGTVRPSGAVPSANP